MPLYAFHRTHRDNVTNIVINGLQSMMTQGYEFPSRDMEQSEYSECALALRAAGFKYCIPTLWDIENSPFGRRDYGEARRRWMSTFATIGKVESHWCGGDKGVTILIDLDRLDYDMIVDYDYHGIEDELRINGDVPAYAIIGTVSKKWVLENGYEYEGRF